MIMRKHKRGGSKGHHGGRLHWIFWWQEMPFLLVKSLHFQDRHHCHQKVRVLRLPEIQARKRWDKNEHDGRSVALETDSRCSIRIWDTIDDNGDDDFWSLLWWWWWAKQWQLPVCSKWLYIARGLGGFDRVGSSIRPPITFDQGTSWNVGFWTGLPIHILLMVCVFWPLTKLNLND